MKETISRRKVLGAIGGSMVLAGCGERVEESDRTSQGITYEGYHESSDPVFDIKRTGHDVSPDNCGVKYAVIISVGGGTGFRTSAELVTYLYHEGTLVGRSVMDLGVVGGKDDYPIEEIADNGRTCDIDAFKLAVHDTS